MGGCLIILFMGGCLIILGTYFYGWMFDHTWDLFLWVDV